MLSPTSWCPIRYVLCELEMKYSGSGRVMSWVAFDAGSANALLSDEVKNEVNPSRSSRGSTIGPAPSSVGVGAIG